MRSLLRWVGWTVGGAVTLIALLIASRLVVNLARSEARGARSLRELSAHAEPPVRDAARAALAEFATQPWMRGREWVAVVDRRPHGDTLVLGVFRAEDATVVRRMLMPHPYVSGAILYDTVRKQLLGAGVGVE